MASSRRALEQWLFVRCDSHAEYTFWLDCYEELREMCSPIYFDHMEPEHWYACYSLAASEEDERHWLSLAPRTGRQDIPVRAQDGPGATA